MSPRRRLIKPSPLSLFERWIYLIVTVVSIVYICYCVYRDSLLYDGILSLYDFVPGWSWTGREQDISNFEWHYWFYKFWEISPWYLGHIAIGRITEWHSLKSRKYLYLAFSVVALCKLVGWQSVCLYLTHTTILYLVAMTAYTALVWITSLVLLSTLNFTPTVSFMKSLLEDDEYETWYYLLMFTLALINIRATSFSIDLCWDGQQQTLNTQESVQQNPDTMYNQVSSPDDDPARVTTGGSPANREHDIRGGIGNSYIDMLFYVLYLPLFFTGPILTYNNFKAQISSDSADRSRSRLLSLTLQLFRYIFWAYFNQFILHFLYFDAIQNSLTVLKVVPQFTLAGLGYCHGQFFMLKYLVMFGYPGTIAKFDNLQPPNPPKCITYIYLYSDMWKYFDSGLYSFLKRYIYIPCGGSKEGFHRQVIGSLLCFMYIFYWHGAEVFILVFILLNYVGVSLEKIGAAICSISVVKHLETQVLSAGMVQRIHGFCSIPIFLISCFSVFCFFGGKEVCYLFFDRLILQGWYGSYTVMVVLLYCAIQNAIEVSRWMDRRQLAQQQKQE